MKSLPLNPYIAGNPISDPKRFFGREDVFREVMKVLRHPQENAIVLYGQRRIGKTSVLLQLEKQLDAGGEFTSVYFDLQDKAAKPLAEVLYELSQCISAKTTRTATNRKDFDKTGDYFRKTFLTTAANTAAPRGLVLLFDEFDVLDNPQQSQAGQAFFPYLRTWMANVDRVHFVFVIGRRPEDLSIDTISAFKGVRSARVSLLERASAEAVVRQSERDSSLIWKISAIEKVWDWTQGHPFFTQLLCNVVWENVYDNHTTNAPIVEAVDVDNSIDKTLQQGANAFHWIWDGLPPAERVVIAAMAEAKETIITQEKLVEILNSSGVRLIVRELELAPETLTEWQLLRPSDGGYRFVVPLLRRWVSTNRPLRRVKDELDRLDPLAEGLYQTGQRFYSLGQNTEAENQLRQALRINPNHLKSRLLLGRILLEGRRADEAVTILDDAYQFDKEASRTALVGALWALAEEQNEAEKLTILDRILSIDHNQPIAKERRRAIWMARGEAALQREAFDEAIAAFQHTEDLTKLEQVQQQKRKRELAIQLETAAQQEVKENWGNAISIYEILLKEFSEEMEWRTRLENAKIQAMLLSKYNEALGALKSGNVDAAKRLLAEIIARQPDYKDAAQYLLQANTGVDVTELKKNLNNLKTKIISLENISQAPTQRGNKNRIKQLATWFASSLLWLPLLVWIISSPFNGDTRNVARVSALSLIIVLAWVVTGSLEYLKEVLNEIWSILIALILSIIVMVMAVTFLGIPVGLIEIMKGDNMIIGVIFGIAYGMTYFVALSIALWGETNKVYFVALGVAFGMVLGLVIGVKLLEYTDSNSVIDVGDASISAIMSALLVVSIGLVVTAYFSEQGK